MSYTTSQEQALRNAAPITNSSAAEFAAEFGVSKRSVIAKAVSLKLYQKAAPRARAAAKATKADVVAQIGEELNAGDLSGLEGASMKALVNLLKSILSLLMLQAAEKKCYNLLLLNTLGIFGYLYALYI